MRTITHNQRELIDAIAVESGISPTLLEKDIHVTDILHALFALSFKHSRFVFCGGTSLSKAYHLIERMSEDVDLKVVMETGHGLSRTAMKNYLREVSHAVKGAIASLGYIEDEAGKKSRNEYRYAASSWLYKSEYESSTALRPHLSLEFTVRDPKFPTVRADVAYLMARFGAPSTATKSIECIAVEETLAEKVLSFLRRHAAHRAGAMEQQWDEALVRHIYDAHCIILHDSEAGERASVYFGQLVEVDRQEFKGHQQFTDNARACLSSALDAAEQEEQTIREYNLRLMPLVYGNIRPDFASAYASFKLVSELLLKNIEDVLPVVPNDVLGIKNSP